ncbi:phosphotransferase [Actinopolymorpha alba]|uniref:phosphotransferase n=1 Tax=Actinopolymorpha alba TaxID=533267 RepID=UPI000377EE18|nr:phosphotransferase [Actinopolymorpha alba]
MSLRQTIRATAQRFGLGRLLEEPEPLREAWSNSVFRVVTEAGTFAVKLFPAVVGPERLATLRAGMAVEAAVLKAGKVPMAEPVPDPDGGDWLVEVAVSGGGPARLARAHAWVDGRPCSAVPPSIEYARDVGRSLGFLHAMRMPAGDTSAVPPLDLERWRRAVRKARIANVPWAVDLAAHTPLVEELADRLDLLRSQRRPMLASHRDLDPKNAVVRPDGRIALTDWDYAGPVLPGVELVVAATSFADGESGVDERLVRAFVSGYHAAGGDAEPPDPLALAVEQANPDWLLRNVEGVLWDVPGDDHELRRRLAPALIGSFAQDVTALDRWARVIPQWG